MLYQQRSEAPLRVVAYLSEEEMRCLRSTSRIHPGVWMGGALVVVVCLLAALHGMAPAVAQPEASPGFTMVVSGAPAPSPAAAGEILPGQGIGPFTLGTPMSQVPALAAAPQTPEGDFLRLNPPGATVWVDSRGAIVAVSITGGDYQSAAGVKIGSGKSDVLELFGSGYAVAGSALRYDREGIAFEFDSADQVSSIRVFPPSSR
ncbi:MAG: hypothetical protein ACYCW6_11550 [Candidatus Xenobia bacterium]